MISGNAVDDGYVTCDTFCVSSECGQCFEHRVVDGRRHRRARLAATPLVMAMLCLTPCPLRRDVVQSHRRHFWLYSEIHVLYERVAKQDLTATHETDVKRRATVACFLDPCSRLCEDRTRRPIKTECLSAQDVSRNS